MIEKEPQSSRVLVTSTSFRTADRQTLDRLEKSCTSVKYNENGRPYTEEELKAAIVDVDGCIAGLDRFSEDVLSIASSLKVISRYGVGVDNVDLAYAREHDVVVTNTPGANAVSVAELTVGLMFALLRRIPYAVSQTKSGAWPRTSGLSVRNKTVGIIGYGAVGRALAKRLAGFECRLLVFDPYVKFSEVTMEGLEACDLEDLLSRSDVVTLHLPETDETRNIADHSFFEQMKPGAFLINTARGGLVNEDHLVEALESGKLSGAALDVFSSEPPSPNNRLLNMQNVVVTPHMAAHSDDAVNAMARMAVEDCIAVLQGQRPRYPVG